MAVVGTAKERFGSRQQSYDGNVWKAQRSWLVKTDTWSDDANTVSGASGLPAYGEAHPAPIAAAMYCKTIAYSQLSDSAPMVWTVTADYDSGRQSDSTNPDNDEVLISFNSEIYQEAIWQDKDNKAIMNSANDPFDPPATVDNNQLIATIQSNHKSIPPWILNYQNAVNSAGFTIGGLQIGQGLAKVNRITVSSRQLRGTEEFYSLTTEIHIKKSGWRLEPLDQGLQQKEIGANNQPTGELIPIFLADKEVTTKPHPLDGNGLAFYGSTPTTAVYLNFRVHDELDFTALPGIT